MSNGANNYSLQYRSNGKAAQPPRPLKERCPSCGQVVPVGQLHLRVRGEGIRCLC